MDNQNHQLEEKIRNKDLGILCHVTSLPSKYGMGSFGKESYDFIDFLSQNGFSTWQILPLNYTNVFNCPYGTMSSFSIDEMFVDVEDLIARGLISEEDTQTLRDLEKSSKVNYGVVKAEKKRLLTKAYSSLTNADIDKLNQFMAKNSFVFDNAYYRVLTEKYKTQDWRKTPVELQDKNSPEAKQFIKDNADGIYMYAFFQSMVYEEWAKIRDYANQKGIKIFGDLPIYPDKDSFDVFNNPEMYKLDEDKMPYVTGGVPADEFCKDGQDWGTCIYNWDKMKEDNYEYLLNKIEIAMKNFDIVRLDHFLGYFYHYENDVKNKSKNKWVAEGGEKFFRALIKRIGQSRIVVENLGAESSEGKRLMDMFGLKGMSVLQIAGASKENEKYLPQNVSSNEVYYTGTHDNNTFIGYLEGLNKKQRTAYCKSIGADPSLTNEQILAYSYQKMLKSDSSVVVMPSQDFLMQNETFKMNIPGQAEDCWEYAMPENYQELIIENLNSKFLSSEFLKPEQEVKSKS